MGARDWTGVDYYRELGVSPRSTRAEISSAYRARARALHPDVGASDQSAVAEFARASAAYRVLTGPLRAEYDDARRRGRAAQRPTVATTAAGAGRRGGWQLGPGGARAALWAGIGLILASVAVAVAVVAMQVRDSQLRGDGIRVEALVVRADGTPRLSFTTRQGAEILTDVPDPKSGGWTVGASVEINYERQDPTHVVPVEQTLARDITLWVVAAKLLLVGAVLAVVGIRSRRGMRVGV